MRPPLQASHEYNFMGKPGGLGPTRYERPPLPIGSPFISQSGFTYKYTH